ncbi:MAG: phosphate ABC transporter permease PstA [Clostridiales bacterium]|nr:phosphate ABC transporter permease PstA [Clostridiales bacterium]
MEKAKKNRIITGCIGTAAALTVSILIVIIGFIFFSGAPKISLKFLTGEYNAKTSYLTIQRANKEYAAETVKKDEVFVPAYGITIKKGVDEKSKPLVIVTAVKSDSPAKNAVNGTKKIVPLVVGAEITKIGSVNVSDQSIEELAKKFEESGNSIKIKAVIPGGGILPLIITTLLTILISLLIVIPIGVCAAIYLIEYAKGGKLLSIIRFATESLAGIPSILFGLFGLLFFVKFIGIGQSIFAGSLTLSILLLPTVIRTTEETLKTIPQAEKEASYGLGANRLQTLVRIILPGAIPGILVAVILSTGRIVGESAALLFTAGTYAKTPSGIFDSAATMTVRSYVEVKEYGNVEMASAIGIVLIMIVLILNISSRVVSNRLLNKKQAKD